MVQFLALVLAGPALAPYEEADAPRGEVVAEISGEEVEYGSAEHKPEPKPTPSGDAADADPLVTALSRPSPSGHSGLVRTMDAKTGGPMGWSLGSTSTLFVKKGFLYTKDVKDRHVHYIGTLHVSFAPLRFLELYLAVGFRVDSTDLSIQDPSTYRRLGNSLFGVKGVLPVSDLYSIALAVTPRFFVEVDGLSFDWDATSVSLLLAQTFDLSASTPVPLRIHLNLGWDFNNTARLVAKREREASAEAGFPQYVMRFERFVLDVSRVDFLLAALALEVVTSWASPFVEWTYRVPVSRQGFDCIGGGPTAFPDDDSCLHEEQARAFHMDL
ncbi:MAG: hypothetical protein JRG91_16320, partial [Deltaproteobacteria bacterium]|nr:hypothetical protein [Deltaproteobacteria bacterium]